MNSPFHYKDPKKQKEELRKWRRQRFMEALRYHHKPNAEKLKETTVVGGYKVPKKEGINEDFQSKVGQKLQDMRGGLFSAREKARARAGDVFKGLGK